MHNYSKQQKNCITTEDGIINSQLYVLMGHKGGTRYMEKNKKQKTKFISGTNPTYSTTKPFNQDK